jgi:PleD family two-component response regulator
MIVCAVDDLIFSVKISTAAKALGVGVYFERTPGHIVSTVREKRPSLVILDLNSSRLAPMAVIAALKADPELKDTRTLGYVSHVDSGTIDAARQAGIDEVLARSAFTQKLGEILVSAGRPPGGSPHVR